MGKEEDLRRILRAIDPIAAARADQIDLYERAEQAGTQLSPSLYPGIIDFPGYTRYISIKIPEEVMPSQQSVEKPSPPPSSPPSTPVETTSELALRKPESKYPIPGYLDKRKLAELYPQNASEIPFYLMTKEQSIAYLNANRALVANLVRTVGNHFAAELGGQIDRPIFDDDRVTIESSKGRIARKYKYAKGSVTVSIDNWPMDPVPLFDPSVIQLYEGKMGGHAGLLGFPRNEGPYIGKHDESTSVYGTPGSKQDFQYGVIFKSFGHTHPLPHAQYLEWLNAGATKSRFGYPKSSIITTSGGSITFENGETMRF